MKPAFAIKSWRLDLERDLDASEFFGHSTGFLLQVELEQGESRFHLLKSLKSGKSVEKRLVAIAPVQAPLAVLPRPGSDPARTRLGRLQRPPRRRPRRLPPDTQKNTVSILNGRGSDTATGAYGSRP